MNTEDYNRAWNKIVPCKHNECKDERTCLRYLMAVSKTADIDDLLEGLDGEYSREELEQMF